MTEPSLPLGLAAEWISLLLHRASGIWTARKDELRQVFDVFGDAELLAKAYVEPDCQTLNPADFLEDEPIPTWAFRQPVHKALDHFLGREFLERDGRNTLFVLSDAGMGKSSLLMMLKLTHLFRFWPSHLDFFLLKLGDTSLEDIRRIEDRKNTVLLLDSLDEDPSAWGRIETRIRELLHEVQNFRQVIVTCRTQFFPKGGALPIEKVGRVEIAGFVCNLLYLSPFTDRQVHEYLRKTFPEKLHLRIRRFLTGRNSELFERAWRTTQAMKSLRMRPMLLAYIRDLIEIDVQDWREYPVYKALVSYWLLREERKKLERPITRERLLRACQVLAVTLQARGGRTLTTDEVEALRADDPVVGVLERAEVGGRSLLNRTSGGELRFSHYSIQEFLVAESMVENLVPEGTVVRGTDQILSFVFSWVAEAPRDRLPHLVWESIDLGDVEAPDVDFSEIDLRGAEIPHVVLRSANLTGCDLRGVDLLNANLKGCKLSRSQMGNSILNGADLSNGSLTYVNLANARLCGARFCNANLACASLRSAAVTGTDFRGANLVDADFQGVDLKDAENLREASLMRARLEGASLEKANLARARMGSAILRNANLRSVILRGADLEAADLRGADLEGADLQNANLRFADLREAKLVSADLTGAQVWSAKLWGADVTGVKLDSAARQQIQWT